MKTQYLFALLIAAFFLAPVALNAAGKLPKQLRRAFGGPSHVRLNAARINVARAALLRDKLHSRINAADLRFAHYDVITGQAVPEYSGQAEHGVITRWNADLATQGSYREELTTYAVGYTGVNFAADREALAPGVRVADQFAYHVFDNAEAFYSELTDDLRAPRADFKEVEYTNTRVLGETFNRGLMMVVDPRQVRNMPNWEQVYTRKLQERLMLNSARRAMALLVAGAVNVGKVWDTTAGKNPDGDVRTQIKTGHTLAGVRPNRAAFGPTAWDLRVSSHEGQNNAGGYAAAGRDEVALARYLGIEQVLICQARYATSASAKAEALANLVILYNAMANALPEDASNIKRFWSPCENGQEIQVHRWDVGPKKMFLAVEMNEFMKLTSTLGLRTITATEE